jgi:hypothetical protein
MVRNSIHMQSHHEVRGSAFPLGFGFSIALVAQCVEQQRRRRRLRVRRLRARLPLGVHEQAAERRGEDVARERVLVVVADAHRRERGPAGAAEDDEERVEEELEVGLGERREPDGARELAREQPDHGVRDFGQVVGGRALGLGEVAERGWHDVSIENRVGWRGTYQ